MMIHPLLVVLLCCSLAGALFFVGTMGALKKRHLLGALQNLLVALLFFALTACSGLLYIANHGYRMLTKEVVAATITITPYDRQRFAARVQLPDSTSTSYIINGDQLYVDAHILKWRPWLNVLGVQTSYELDRIGGRYRSLADEKTKPRTVYSLSKKIVGVYRDTPLLDMFELRRRFAVFTPFLDAEYGSASFADSHRAGTIQVMVSVSGLLIRSAPATHQAKLQEDPL